jgi:putative phosphoesterase
VLKHRHSATRRSISSWHVNDHTGDNRAVARFLRSMHLAIISDVHGNLVALEAVLADLAARSPDAIINLGDVATGPLWPRETVELLSTTRAMSIRGNHDRWLTQSGEHDVHWSVEYTRTELGLHACAQLAELPASLSIDGTVLAVHGSPQSDTAHLLDNAGDVLVPKTTEQLARDVAAVKEEMILCGHSHRPGLATASGKLIVNPGAVGGPRFLDNDHPHLAEAGAHLACYAIATRAQGMWRVEMISVPYDVRHVEQRAAANGRTSWLAAYRRGAGSG